MAKRKRLTPFSDAELPIESAPVSEMRPAPGFAPPIARVAGDVAREAAFEEISEALRQARAEGRLIQKLPLGQIEAEHLVRDRAGLDEAEMAPLIESLRARGQQTPIEVVALETGGFGLISGWRRLTALRRLHAETGDARFASVLAILRRPRDAAEAYVAMVEENEIRLGLSYYERARIVARSVEAGVFPDAQAALRALFANGSRARRSKIGSFLVLVRQLDGALRFPAAIGERLGLQLAQALEAEQSLNESLMAALDAAGPESSEAEAAVLTAALARPKAKKDPGSMAEEIRPGIRLEVKGRGKTARLLLSGEGVDPAFQARLRDWLAREG